MTVLRATINGGRLQLDARADWPDGTEVEIHPVPRGVTAGGDRACDWVTKGRYGEALADFSEAVRVNPKNPA
jgi:hypothetical protein